MKIGLPRIRFTRKVLLISIGMLALLAGSGAAALYVGAGDMLTTATPEDNVIGGACTTVETVVLKTPAKRLWLRKYVRMDHADGPTRIRTALRVAGLLANANPVDLIQVSVLDTSGPVLKSQIRGRAIGAEVVIALQPNFLPDMKEPFIVRYYEGMPSSEGIYYGQRISLEVPEIQKLVKAMRDVPDKEDCTPLPVPDSAKAKEPGEHIVSVEGEAPAGHEAKPAGEEKQADDHEAPAGENAEGKDSPKKEPSFLDSVLSMVGLGGSEEKPAENHDAKANDHGAVPDDAMEPAANADEHASEPAAKHEVVPATQDAGHEPAKVKHTADETPKGDDHAAGDEVH